VLTLSLENSRIFFKEKLILMHSHLKRLVVPSMKVLRAHFVHWTKPFTSSLPLGTLADLARSKAERVRGKCALTTATHHAQASSETTSMHEERSHPPCARSLERFGPGSKRFSLFSQKPSCGFHREAFHLFWRRKSKVYSHKPRQPRKPSR
jgi:hypothetical protein